MKLWLQRHARPLVDSGVCYGALDVAADAAATAMAAQQSAKAVPRHFLVWYSPLQRCERLALVLQGLRPDLTFIPEPRLREMDFGCWEGVAWADIPKQAMDDWVADFGALRFGGVESTNGVLARVAQARRDFDAMLTSRAQREGLWITHAGVARAVRLLAAGMDRVENANEWPRDGLAYGDLTTIDLD